MRKLCQYPISSRWNLTIIHRSPIVKYLKTRITPFLLVGSMILSACVESSNAEEKTYFSDARYAATLSGEVHPVTGYQAGLNGRSTEGPSWTDPAFLQLVGTMSPMCVRYPAGTQANSWDWRTGAIMGKTARYPFLIKDFTAGLPLRSQIIYVMNMARPTPATGYTGNETEAVLKSEEVLRAKIQDALEALAEFERYGRLPVAVELGNEFYFDNEHAAIYAVNPTLYLDHSTIITREIRKRYPNMYFLLCTTKGGTTGRDRWNSAVYDRLAADSDLRGRIRGTVQHHYIDEKFGNQESVTTLDKAEEAIGEGFDYVQSVAEDYNRVPAGMKLWITEYGVTKRPDECGMWVAGLQYVALSLGWFDLGDKIENILCHHITLEPGILDKQRMALQGVGVAYGTLMRAMNGKSTMQKIVFDAKANEDKSGALELHGRVFISGGEKVVFVLNGTRTEKTNVDFSSVLGSGKTVSVENYWSDRPLTNPSYLGEDIQYKVVDATADNVDLKPFSITVIKVKS